MRGTGFFYSCFNKRVSQRPCTPNPSDDDQLKQPLGIVTRTRTKRESERVERKREGGRQGGIEREEGGREGGRERSRARVESKKESKKSDSERENTKPVRFSQVYDEVKLQRRYILVLVNKQVLKTILKPLPYI